MSGVTQERVARLAADIRRCHVRAWSNAQRDREGLSAAYARFVGGLSVALEQFALEAAGRDTAMAMRAAFEDVTNGEIEAYRTAQREVV